MALVFLASCAAPATVNELDIARVTVGDEVITVAVASTTSERNQGLADIDALPDTIQGMLFVWDEPTATTFTMRDVGFPLDIWFFDDSGRLVGSAGMDTCPDGGCTSYGTPGAVSWALETPSGEWDFAPGTALSNVEYD